MGIIQKTSTVHTSLYQRRPILYLAFHYTAGTKSAKGTARSVAAMFGSSNSRDASADFIVDDAEIVQYNPDLLNRYCWALGGAKYPQLSTSQGAILYGKARNYNSISIEICSCKTNKSSLSAYDTDWYLTDAAVANAVELGRYLMEKFNIPIERCIMHHHVNGKLCPQPWTLNEGRLASWNTFKPRLIATSKPVEKEEEDMGLTEAQVKTIVKKELADQRQAIIYEVLSAMPKDKIYNSLKEIPEWAQDAVQRRLEPGVLKGVGDGKLGLTFSDLRAMVMKDREEELKKEAAARIKKAKKAASTTE